MEYAGARVTPLGACAARDVRRTAQLVARLRQSPGEPRANDRKHPCFRDRATVVPRSALAFWPARPTFSAEFRRERTRIMPAMDWMIGVEALGVFLAIVALTGVRYIRNDRIGIVEKRWSMRGSVQSGLI